MPLNTDLYPPTWTDICPGTQVQESNVTDELQRQIRVLRNQLQLSQKKHGRSIAELQNQTIPIANVLFPAVTVGRHFMGGGEFNGLTDDISRLNHYTELISTTGLTLSSPGIRKAGTASTARGYWCGGLAGDYTTLQNAIESVIYQSETKGSVSANLAVATQYARGGFSQTKGYIFGNTIAGSGSRKIEALTFAGETVANLGNLLINATNGATGLVQSSTKIYNAGGADGTRIFDAFTTSSETVAALSAQLSVTRYAPMHCQSTAKGYIVSGQIVTTWAPAFTIDALTFSNETLATLSNALSLFAGTDGEGASAARRGYWWEGYIVYGRRDVQAFTFASETPSLIGATLKRSGRYCVPVGMR